MWGVTIDPHTPRDARVSVVLMKFLRARYHFFYATHQSRLVVILA
jgi:hypothetical protein